MSVATAAAAETPSLVVVISIDQFRADYLTRFQPHFGPGGFNLLLERGANFVDCHYRHAATKTGPGHATILTGVHADVHGIIANDWMDRATLRRMNCVDDEEVQVVGRMEMRGSVRMPGATKEFSASPRNLLATTVGDNYKLSRGGQPKIVSISSKDRAAILLGGQTADAAYWMERGNMVTSTYYRQELPEWVQAFNTSGRVEAYFGTVWERLLPVEAYEALQGPDDVPGEYEGLGMTRTFPKRIDGGEETLTTRFYDAFEHTPFKSEVMMEFVHLAIDQEKLGQRGATDFLCIGFSVNDTVGHDSGPDSHEVMDITVRTDRMLARLFEHLEARVGLDRCTIVLTADHGVAPLPERLKAIDPRMDAGRITPARALTAAEEAMNDAFGPLTEGQRWMIADSTWLLFLPEALQEKKVDRGAAENVVHEALLKVEFVNVAYTRTQLEAGSVPGALGRSAILSFHAARSGDVYYVPKPFWIERPRSGTTHGTPYNYDTHVPLLWFGAGVKPGVYRERVGVDDLAPTLSHLLGISAPPQSKGRVLF